MLNLTNDEVLNYEPDVEDIFMGTCNEKGVSTFMDDIKYFINNNKNKFTT
jgi:hypothetical protein